MAPPGNANPAQAVVSPSQGLARNQDPSPPESTFIPGEVLAGRFRIQRFIAQGGAGEVYEAEDLELRGPVALKVVRPEIADNEQAIERFRREIQLARQVTHANVCRIFDVFRHEIPDSREGRPPRTFLFLTMELLLGESLAARLHRLGPLATEQALPIVRDMANGLAAAHRAGVVHRDFKSANVVLVPRKGGFRAVITDFGLARGQAASEQFPATITQSGTVVGTPTYMSPEQLTGGDITPAVDTYALGIVMYEMVTGQRPFKGGTDLSTAVKRLTEAPESPHLHLPELDPRWVGTILACLERDAADRPALEDLVPRLADPHELPPSESSITTSRQVSRPPQAPLAIPELTPQPASESKAGRLRLIALVVLLAAAVASGFLLSDLTDRWSGGRRLGTLGSSSSKPTIAVLQFKNLSGNEVDAWLSAALQEMVNMELAAGNDLLPLPSESVDRVAAELQVDGASGLAEDTVRRIGKQLRTNQIIDGSFLTSGGEIRLHLRLHTDMDSVALLTVPGKQDELFDLVTRAGDELRSRLGLMEYLGRRESLGDKPEAVALYERGMEHMQQLNAPAARDLFARAVDNDPIHAQAYSGLATSTAFVGYREQALRAARRAVDLAEPLSREQKLAIEANYHVLRGDWPQAASLYSSLFRFFPTNVEYGLGLARSLAASDRGEEAMTALTQLKEGLPEDALDLRIALVEAGAAEAIGDVEHQLDMARQAIAASSGDSQFLGAEAQLLEARALVEKGALAEARRSLEAARRTFVSGGVPRGVVASLRLLAAIAELRGDATAARALREEADGVEASLQATASAADDALSRARAWMGALLARAG